MVTKLHLSLSFPTGDFMNQQAINMPYKSSMPFGSSSSNVIHSSGNSYNSFGGGGGNGASFNSMYNSFGGNRRRDERNLRRGRRLSRRGTVPRV